MRLRGEWVLYDVGTYPLTAPPAHPAPRVTRVRAAGGALHRRRHPDHLHPALRRRVPARLPVGRPVLHARHLLQLLLHQLLQHRQRRVDGRPPRSPARRGRGGGSGDGDGSVGLRPGERLLAGVVAAATGTVIAAWG